MFCDPRTYPRIFPSDHGFKCAVGLHPREASQLTSSLMSEIEGLLRNPRVGALGETGLDYTEPDTSWGVQEHTLIQLMLLSMPIRPVILHLRDRNNQYSNASNAKCLKIATTNLASTQRIHLHCYTGNLQMTKLWMEQFPSAYFGFSSLVRHFDEEQIRALKHIPINRLLIETDSPYLRPSKGRNTPAYLGDVAMLVSERRGISTAELLKATSINAEELYRL